jgi:DNA-binding response OmpR family regulator
MMATWIVPESRVLVVEDDDLLRTVVAEALREDGYDVETAADGEVALDLASRTRPDLVILDLMIPYVSGEEFARAIRLMDGLVTTPIVLISAARHADEVGARIGAKRCLRKPFDLFELIDSVHELLHPAP